MGYTESAPCPICGGWDKQPRGKGIRCWGFIRENGTIAECYRVKSEWPTDNGGWAHPLKETDKRPPVKTSAEKKALPPPQPYDGDRLDALVVFQGKAPRGYRLDPDDVYDVRDANGRILIIQTAYRDGKGKKICYPWTQDAVTGWKPKDRGLKTFFGVDALASKQDAPVLVVEGPKTKRAAESIFPDHAVVSPFGGKGSTDSLLDALKGRHTVIYWPDADKDGGSQKAFLKAAEKTEADDVRIVELPDTLPDGWDLADPIPEGVDLETLLASAAPVKRDSTQSGESVFRLKTITDTELSKKVFAPIKWAIPDLIPEGLFILGGKPKIGKSWLVMGLADAVARGGYALGKHQVEAGDVLYLACEDSEKRIQSRRITMMDPGDGHCERLQIVTAGNVPTMENNGIGAIRQWLDDHPGARLVVIDTLARFRGGQRQRGQNAYEADVAALAPLQHLAIEKSVAILAVTHLRKADISDDPQDLISGSLGQAGTADGSGVLRRGRGGADGELFITGRDIEERCLALSFRQDKGTWTILGDAAEIAVSQSRREIIEYLRENPGSRLSEIATELGRDKRAIGNILQRLKDSNVAHQDSGKKWSLVSHENSTTDKLRGLRGLRGLRDSDNLQSGINTEPGTVHAHQNENVDSRVQSGLFKQDAPVHAVHAVNAVHVVHAVHVHDNVSHEQTDMMLVGMASTPNQVVDDDEL